MQGALPRDAAKKLMAARIKRMASVERFTRVSLGVIHCNFLAVAHRLPDID